MNDDPNRPGYPANPPYPPYQRPYDQAPGQPYDPNAAPGGYPPDQQSYGAPPYAPYAPPPYGALPPRKGSAVPWVLGGCAGLLVLVVAVLGLLAFIGARQSTSASSAVAGSTTTTSAPAAAATDAAAPAATAPTTPAAGTVDVQGTLQRAAANMQPRLPLTMGNLTVTSVTASATSLDLEGTISEDMGQTGFDQFDTGMRQGLCSSGFGDVIRAGGVLRLSMTDTGGNGHMLFVRDC